MCIPIYSECEIQNYIYTMILNTCQVANKTYYRKGENIKKNYKYSKQINLVNEYTPFLITNQQNLLVPKQTQITFTAAYPVAENDE